MIAFSPEIGREEEKGTDIYNAPFFWGVATSGYQTEGGYNGANEPLNSWAWAERSNEVARSGKSADFWNLYREDFARCRALGLNAFRLSLEWSRIQPARELDPKGEPQSPPPFDEEALRHYAEILAECRAAGLEPIVTWHHFVQPAWLGGDAWFEEKTIDHFVAFVDHTLRYLLEVLPRDFGCAPPRYFITINEPNLLPANHYLYAIFPTRKKHRGLKPTMQCLAKLLEAHVRCYQRIHEIYRDQDQPPMVTFNNYCSDLYWSDQSWIDLFFCPQEGVPRDRVFAALHEKAREFDQSFKEADLLKHSRIRYRLGEVLKWFHHRMARVYSQFEFWEPLLEAIYEQKKPCLDFIAFDYYDPFIAHALRWPRWSDHEPRPRSIRDWMLESITSKWWDWRVLPEGLEFFVKRLTRYNLPLLIAENGMAQRRRFDNHHHRRGDNWPRSLYLREHVRMTGDLKVKGYPLIGYLHWSLVDNYEWGSYTPRFGLYSIDFMDKPERHAVDKLGDNPSKTYAAEIVAARRRFS